MCTSKRGLYGGWGYLLGSSAGKGSACNAGDPSSIPGSRSSLREGIGYPLQCSWGFLVAQMVKNPPAVWETWVRTLGWKDPLEDSMATHSNILAWRIPTDRGAWRTTVHGVTKSLRRLSTAQHMVDGVALATSLSSKQSQVMMLTIYLKYQKNFLKCHLE